MKQIGIDMFLVGLTGILIIMGNGFMNAKGWKQ